MIFRTLSRCLKNPIIFFFSIAIIILSLPNPILAQTSLDRLVENSSEEFPNIKLNAIGLVDNSFKNYVADYKIFDIDDLSIARIFENKLSSLTLTIPSTDGDVLLKLVQHDFTSSGFEVKLNNTETVALKTSGQHYRGIVEGNEKSMAAVSVFKDEIAILASTRDKGNLIVRKLKNTGKYISYYDSKLLIQSNDDCTAMEELTRELNYPKFDAVEEGRLTTNCVNVHIEANYKTFLDLGSSVLTRIIHW